MACSERVTAVCKGRAPEARDTGTRMPPSPAPPTGGGPHGTAPAHGGLAHSACILGWAHPWRPAPPPAGSTSKSPRRASPRYRPHQCLRTWTVGPVGNQCGQARRWHSRGRHGEPPRRQKSGAKRGPGTRPAARRINGPATATGGPAPCPPRPAATAIRRCHTGRGELRRRRGQRRAGPAACNTRSSVACQGLHCPGRLRD